MTDVCKVFDAVLLTSLERRRMSLSLAVHAKDCSRSPLSIGEPLEYLDPDLFNLPCRARPDDAILLLISFYLQHVVSVY